MTQPLVEMSVLEQIEFCVFYLKRSRRGRTLSNPIQLRLLWFYPAALDQINNDEYVFGKGQHDIRTTARQNKNFDINKDKKITMKEYKEYHFDKFKNEIKILETN